MMDSDKPTQSDQPEPADGPETPDMNEQHNSDSHLKIEDLYPAKKRTVKQKLLMGVGFLALLALLGFGAYKIGSRKPATNSTANTQSQKPATETAEKDVPDVSETKTYENGFLGIKFTYPGNWKVVENDNRDNVRIESPEFNYKSTDTGAVTGNFRILIRRGARTADGQYIGRGYAMAASEKLLYSDPAPGQRADTLLTLFGLDTPDNFGFFLIAGNFNLNQGDTLGPDYGKEAETYIIAGGYSTKELTDDLATKPVSPELIQTSNAYKQAKKILESLQVR